MGVACDLGNGACCLLLESCLPAVSHCMVVVITNPYIITRRPREGFLFHALQHI